jgi:hypothetical protein
MSTPNRAERELKKAENKYNAEFRRVEQAINDLKRVDHELQKAIALDDELSAKDEIPREDLKELRFKKAELQKQVMRRQPGLKVMLANGADKIKVALITRKIGRLEAAIADRAR